MQSALTKGIQSRKKCEIFPTSPSLLKYLQIEKTLYDSFIIKRSQIIEQKNNFEPVDPRLRPYQNGDVRFLLQFKNGVMLFNEQRTGKTPDVLTTLRLSHYDRNIIFVPKTAIIPWRQEYAKWHGGPIIEIKPHWNKEKREKIYAAAPKNATLIINYAKARTDYDILIQNLSPFDAIVVDEAHILRNYTNKASRSNAEGKTKYNSPQTINKILSLRNYATSAYALTGTPNAGKDEHIFGILAFTFPDLFTSFNKFIDYFFYRSIEEYYINGERKISDEVIGFKSKQKEQELLEFLELFSIQRKRKDVMQWLPAVDKEIIWFDPTPNMRKWHDELTDYFETENISCPNKLTVMTAQRQLAVYPKILNLPEDGPIFEWLKDYQEEYKNTPTLILSSFTSILEELRKVLNLPTAVLLRGSTTAENREKARIAFQKGEYNILLGNTTVVNVNMTLSRAETLIYLDKSMIYVENEQADDRILATTQEEAIKKNGQRIITLAVKKTITPYLLEQLEKKKEKAEIINDYIQHLTRKEKK